MDIDAETTEASKDPEWAVALGTDHENRDARVYGTDR